MTEFHCPFDLIEEEEPFLHPLTPGPQHQVPNNPVHHCTPYFPTNQVPILSSVSLSLKSGSRRDGGNSLHQTTTHHSSNVNSTSIPLQPRPRKPPRTPARQPSPAPRVTQAITPILQDERESSALEGQAIENPLLSRIRNIEGSLK
ncbi:hypothetical protein L873DRAFT_63920 [Choiromyces venosus 120613-1]|uniref:Uncharacterized protein n=1 Tax=Choiromyces venosus 120613-1 TaxID=1336337 RepID=A0A3N4J513_9PEZI|nr:hypothetical protein L873DRAFT_63920 [Choiromyces venosus 120613-1]